MSPTSGRSPRNLIESGTARLVIGAWLLLALSAPLSCRAQQSGPQASDGVAVEAQFRGCEAAGWCLFLIEPADARQHFHRVHPDGVAGAQGDSAVAVRDRLNALLASMIHQHKRIALQDMREVGDGTYAARVTVNGADVASDPILLELRGDFTREVR